VIKSKGQEHREKIRKKFFAGADAWTGENEKGWFYAPRTLPLLLNLISSKKVSGKCDPSRVYLELWARHMGGGVIQMVHEAEHAYGAGYKGPRGIRTWQERMNLLEKHGIIKTKRIGNQKYKYALLIHPTTVVEQLRLAGSVDEDWLDAYKDRQMETKELTFSARKKAGVTPKVVPIKMPSPVAVKATAS